MFEYQKHIDRAWEHSGKLFDLILDITKDERISIELRLEILKKLGGVVDSSRTKVVQDG